MSARFSRCLLAAVLGSAGYSQQKPAATNQTPGVNPATVHPAQKALTGRGTFISLDRSFNSSGIPNPPDDWEVQFEKLDWAKKFLAIDPARSLLLYDCTAQSPWCGSKDFAFSAWFAQAAAVAHLSPDDAVLSWYKSAAAYPLFPDQVAPWKGMAIQNAPFQPLAVVNRMDLAHFDQAQAKWVGAEIRFVYGVIPPPLSAMQPIPDKAKLNLILEFTVPPRSWDEFQNLALKWMALTTAPAPDPQAAPDGYLPFLKAATREGNLERSPLVRLRMNRSVAATRWGLSQWEFSPGGFMPAALTDQVDDSFRTALPNTGPYTQYLKLWVPLTSAEQDAGSIAIEPSTLLAKGELLYTKESLETPQGMCNVDQSTRNILAMQQCRFCHTNETAVEDFTHISNRKPGESSKLSQFIKGTNMRPSILQLWYAPSSAFLNSAVPYATNVGPSSTECAPTEKVAQRSFNDLARRALFLAGVLAFPEQNDQNAYLIQLARTNFSH